MLVSKQQAHGALIMEDGSSPEDTQKPCQYAGSMVDVDAGSTGKKGAVFFFLDAAFSSRSSSGTSYAFSAGAQPLPTRL